MPQEAASRRPLIRTSIDHRREGAGALRQASEPRPTGAVLSSPNPPLARAGGRTGRETIAFRRTWR